MTVALQIRDVSEDVRDVLAERAARDGKSLQAYLLEMVAREARMLRNATMFDRTVGALVDIPEALSPERIIRAGREAQSRGIARSRDEQGGGE